MAEGQRCDDTVYFDLQERASKATQADEIKLTGGVETGSPSLKQQPDLPRAFLCGYSPTGMGRVATADARGYVVFAVLRGLPSALQTSRNTGVPGCSFSKLFIRPGSAYWLALACISTSRTELSRRIVTVSDSRSGELDHQAVDVVDTCDDPGLEGRRSRRRDEFRRRGPDCSKRRVDDLGGLIGQQVEFADKGPWGWVRWWLRFQVVGGERGRDRETRRQSSGPCCLTRRTRVLGPRG